MALLLDPDHGTAMCSDFPVLDTQDQQQQVAGLFQCAPVPRKLMWLVMHLHGFSRMRDASQPNYINTRKINALAMPVLFLARTCQNSPSKCILSHNCIQSMGGTMLPSFTWCRDEHCRIFITYKNSMPESKSFEVRMRGQDVRDTAWRSSLLAGWDGDPMKNLNKGS